MKTAIQYYASPGGNNPVREFINSLQNQQKAKIFRIFLYIKEYGLTASIPYVRKLSGTLLWEIRILGQDNIRIIYIVPQANTLLLLHGFIKKTQKTPARELETAAGRYKEWLTRTTID